MGFRALGWISMILAFIASSPYWLTRLNNWTFKSKDPRFFKFIKLMRKTHKWLGVLLVMVALIHGYLAYRLNPHTGLLVFTGFFLTMILGLWHHFAKKKNRRVFKAHKTMVLISFLLLLTHLLWPGALGELFGIWRW